jgi:hypothetical protein
VQTDSEYWLLVTDIPDEDMPENSLRVVQQTEADMRTSFRTAQMILQNLSPHIYSERQIVPGHLLIESPIELEQRRHILYRQITNYHRISLTLCPNVNVV